MLVILLFLQAVIQVNSAQYEAQCNMKLHNTTDEIGKVVFKSGAGFQKIEANFEGDPEILTKGHYRLFVSDTPVFGNDCGAASGRQLEIQTTQAGERGEINLDISITIDPTRSPKKHRLSEPAEQCVPIKVKIYPDGREEPYVERRKRSQEKEKRLKKKRAKKERKEKRKKRKNPKARNSTAKKCTKRRELKGKCSTEGADDFFLVLEKMPDCYNPKRERYTLVMKTAEFYLDGDESIVGRAVVLENIRDDLEQGEESGGIACCNLALK